MYEVAIKTEFSAAHRLKNYRGKCENLHGHNWKIEIAVESEILDETGLAMDFTELKAYAADIMQEFDHKNLSDLPAFRSQNPTTENIARIIYNKLEEKLQVRHVKISRVTVSESDASSASYRGLQCEK